MLELGFNWFNKDCGFDTKARSWSGEILINLSFPDEWYKRIERTK
jgi:hypothetical protein